MFELKSNIYREVLAQWPINLIQTAGLSRLQEEKIQDLVWLVCSKPSFSPWVGFVNGGDVHVFSVTIMDICNRDYSRKVIQDGKANGYLGGKSTSSCLVLIMTTLELKKLLQLLKIDQVTKDVQDGWSNYPLESTKGMCSKVNTIVQRISSEGLGFNEHWWFNLSDDSSQLEDISRLIKKTHGSMWF